MGDRPLIEDSEIARSIARVAEQSGVPEHRFRAWLESEPPPGISHRDWWDALRAVSGAPPLPEEALEELAAMVAPHRPKPQTKAKAA